jgi:hypothetical protein
VLYNYGRGEIIKVLLRIEIKQSNKIYEYDDARLKQGDCEDEIKPLNLSYISMQRKRTNK